MAASSSCTPKSLLPGEQAPDRAHELVHLLVGIGRPTVPSDDAVPGVAVEQAEGHLVEGGLDGTDLGEHVDAVPIVLDHAGDAPHLPLDAGQSLEQSVLV